VRCEDFSELCGELCGASVSCVEPPVSCVKSSVRCAVSCVEPAVSCVEPSACVEACADNPDRGDGDDDDDDDDGVE
jgi:hypothetical protein